MRKILFSLGLFLAALSGHSATESDLYLNYLRPVGTGYQSTSQAVPVVRVDGYKVSSILVFDPTLTSPTVGMTGDYTQVILANGVTYNTTSKQVEADFSTVASKASVDALAGDMTTAQARMGSIELDYALKQDVVDAISEISLTPGPKGEKGDQGDPGVNGTNGTNGSDGSPGLKGDKGDKGDQGNPGTPGSAGAPGSKGDKGDPGATGPAGADGAPWSISAPSTGNSFTSGTAFQPRSGGPCSIIVNTSLSSSLLNVAASINISISATQTGTYTTVCTDGVSLVVLGVGDKASALIPIPAGYWVKVTYTVVGLGASASGTYARWNH